MTYARLLAYVSDLLQQPIPDVQHVINCGHGPCQNGWWRHGDPKSQNPGWGTEVVYRDIINY